MTRTWLSIGSGLPRQTAELGTRRSTPVTSISSGKEAGTSRLDLEVVSSRPDHSQRSRAVLGVKPDRACRSAR